MNCQNHPETPATAFCRSCGKPVCNECRRDSYGTVFCAEHAPAPAGMGAPSPAGTQFPPPVSGSPYAAFPHPEVSPGLALFLGMIPGVGAIYNGQYAKGLVHALVFGILMSIADSHVLRGMEPIFIVSVMAWWAYMIFEAYHTARARRAGEPVDEYSSLIDLRGRKDQVPVAAVALIVLGIIMLLHTLNLLDFEYVARWWPVLLIAAGIWLLYGRLSAHTETQEDIRHERQ